jgi:hypothetical protein
VDGVSCGAGFAVLACSAGTTVPTATRSSLFGGWTVLVVIMEPPANPTAIAAKAVPMPKK